MFFVKNFLLINRIKTHNKYDLFLCILKSVMWLRDNKLRQNFQLNKLKINTLYLLQNGPVVIFIYGSQKDHVDSWKKLASVS